MDIDIDSLQQILKSPPGSRSFKNIVKLMNFTQNSKFFKELLNKNSSNLHFLCCQNMYYEFFEAGKYVFFFGDKGNKFYIVLRGKVAVHIPVLDPKTARTSLQEVLQLGKGASFGELALEQNKPRAASILCVQDTHFAVLKKSDYRRLLLRYVIESQMESVIFLQSLPMFSQYTRDTIRKLFFFFKEKQYQRHQVVYKEGDDSTNVFIIKSGEFKFVKKVLVNKKNSQQQTGRPLISEQLKKKEYSNVQLYILARGEIFGEEEVLSNMPRDSTCICTTASSDVLCISKTDFITKIKSEESWKHVKNRISLKYKNKSERLAIISQIQQNEYIDTLDDKEERTIGTTVHRRCITPFTQRADTISRAYDVNKRSFVFRNVEREMSKRENTASELPKSDSRSSSPLLHRTKRPQSQNRLRRTYRSAEWTKSTDWSNFAKTGPVFKMTPFPTPDGIPIDLEEEPIGFSIFSLTAYPRGKSCYLKA